MFNKKALLFPKDKNKVILVDEYDGTIYIITRSKDLDNHLFLSTVNDKDEIILEGEV